MWKKCPYKFKAFYLGEPHDLEREDTQKKIVYLGNEGSDFDDTTEHEEHFTSIQRINVVRCPLIQPNKTDDWRRTAIFYTWMKMGDKNCKVIIDSRRCINVVFQASFHDRFGSSSPPLSLQSLLG